jgi:hypothetical protein
MDFVNKKPLPCHESVQAYRNKIHYNMIPQKSEEVAENLDAKFYQSGLG